ncbi:hypothetical protein H8E77_30995 [bacterium]|nr:hypothetical protein [bacterium]
MSQVASSASSNSAPRSPHPKSFKHRTLVGWISEFSSCPLHEPWPVIKLDDKMMSDFSEIFDLCQQVGFDKMVIWGLFVSRRWPVPLTQAVDAQRRKQIQQLLEAAHERGIKILSGLGVYSWGFEEIIEQFPKVSKGSPRVMCAVAPEAEKWMQQVVDFVLSDFDIDGVQMQSADQNRCQCQECQKFGDVEYHAMLNDNTAQYIRSKWQDKIIAVNNWGLSFANPDDIPHIQRMTGAVDILIDYNNSAHILLRNLCSSHSYRRQLIDNLDCAYGTLAGVSVGPPQRWERTKWFLPTTTTNVPYLRALYDDGGRAVEQFTVALSNPGGEVTLRFIGKLLSDVSRSPDAVLREAIEECFEPKDSTTTDGLMEVFQRAENGFFSNSGRDYGSVGLFYIDGGLFPGEKGDRETYLLRMLADNLNNYEHEIQVALRQLEQIKAGVGRLNKWEDVRQSLNTVLLDIKRIRTGSSETC